MAGIRIDPKPRKKSALFKAYAKVKLLVIDDLELTLLTDGQSRDFFRNYRRSLRQTIAILDRLVNNAHRIKLKGELMRRKKALQSTVNLSVESKKKT